MTAAKPKMPTAGSPIASKIGRQVGIVVVPEPIPD
jgi:hypothetical protein